MKVTKIFVASVVTGFILSILPASGHAADSKVGTHVGNTTIEQSAVLAPGKYTVSVVPSFNSDMGKKLTEAVKALPGIGKASVDVDESTIHFVVQEGSTLKRPDIQKVVAQTVTGGAISAPILDDSTVPHPGL